MTRIGTWEPEATYSSTVVGVVSSASLNLHASAVFSAGERVRSFAIGIPASGSPSGAPVTGEIALYKVLAGDPDGAVRVWSSPVTIPESHLGWFVQPVPYDELVGVTDGDVLCAALSLTSSAGNSYRIHITSPVDNSIPEYASDSYAVSSGKTDPVWEHTSYSNYAPYFYVELEVPSGINEVVPAAVDSIAGDVVPPSGQRVEIAIDWARAVSIDQPGYNVLRSPDEGTVPLLSVEGDPTGITHRVISGTITPWSATAGSAFYDIPRAVWNADWRISGADGAVIELAGFLPGQVVLIEKLSGYAGGNNYRPTQVHINGVPIRLEPYLSTNTPVDPIINVPVVADNDGKLIVSAVRADDGEGYGYLNFAVISYITGSPSDDFVAEVAELVPAATDAATGTFSVPGYSATVAELVPAATDAAIATTAAPEFAAVVAEVVPAALDAGTGATAVPDYVASIAESVPAASDALLVGYAPAPVAGGVAELVPAAVDAAQGSFAIDAAGAVIAESVPAAVDALAGSVSAPIFAGSVTEVLPPAVDQVSAQFAPHRFAAVVAEAVPAAVDHITAISAHDHVTHGNISEQVPAATDVVREFSYQPSMLRMLHVGPDCRTTTIKSGNRVLTIAPERRTLTVGV